MRETKEKEIDGDTYAVQQMGGWPLQRLSIRLGRILAPSLARVGQGATGGLAGLKLENLADAVDMLADKLPPQEYEDIFKLMLEGCLVTEGSGQVPLLKVFDMKMAGKALTGFKLFAFCLETNFQSFSDALADLTKAVGAALKQAQSTSLPKSSTSGPVTDLSSSGSPAAGS